MQGCLVRYIYIRVDRPAITRPGRLQGKFGREMLSFLTMPLQAEHVGTVWRAQTTQAQSSVCRGVFADHRHYVYMPSCRYNSEGVIDWIAMMGEAERARYVVVIVNLYTCKVTIYMITYTNQENL